MSNLITWSQYCNVTSTATNATVQNLVTNTLIPMASDAIEHFCDRKFELQQYIEWQQAVNAFGVFYPKFTPVTRLYSVSAPDVAATINTTTKGINIVIDDESINIFNPITNSGTEYSYDTYSTLSNIFSEITTDNPDITFSLNTDSYPDIANCASNLLAPDTKVLNQAQPIYAALNQIEGKIVGDGIASTGISYSIPTTYNTFYTPAYTYQNGNEFAPLVCINYMAGYKVIPLDLQYVTALIVQDMLNISLGDASVGLKSESIDQYSYTMQDNISLQNLVGTKYAGSLQHYRRTIWG